MSAPLLQARLASAARFATSAILALLLLVAGWSPARALPTLAAVGHGAFGGGAHHLASADASHGLRPAAPEPGTPLGGFDAAAAGHQRLALQAGHGRAGRRAPAGAPARSLARLRARAPPTTA